MLHLPTFHHSNGFDFVFTSSESPNKSEDFRTLPNMFPINLECSECGGVERKIFDPKVCDTMKDTFYDCIKGRRTSLTISIGYKIFLVRSEKLPLGSAAVFWFLIVPQPPSPLHSTTIKLVAALVGGGGVLLNVEMSLSLVL